MCEATIDSVVGIILGMDFSHYCVDLIEAFSKQLLAMISVQQVLLGLLYQNAVELIIRNIRHLVVHIPKTGVSTDGRRCGQCDVNHNP